MNSLVRTKRNRTLVAALTLAAMVPALLGSGVASASSTPAGAHDAALHGLVMGINDDPGNQMDGPLEGASVTVVDARTGRKLGADVTDTGGEYQIRSLPARTVKIRIAKAGFLPVWSDNKPSFAKADTYRLKHGQNLMVEHEQVLWAEAVISGGVHAWFDPIGYAWVTVFNAETGRVLATRLTDESGRYEIGGLPAVPIKVRGEKDGYITDWASNKPDWASADVYSLHAGQHLSQTWDERQILYLDLTPAALIKGQVLGDGKPLSHARVSVIDAATGVVLSCAVADATGHYSIGNLREGPVKVRAEKSGWVTEYANNKPTLASADVLVLLPTDVIDQAQNPAVLQLDLAHG